MTDTVTLVTRTIHYRHPGLTTGGVPTIEVWALAPNYARAIPVPGATRSLADYPLPPVR